MGDEDDSSPLCCETAQDFEKVLDFLRNENRRWFVEDDHLGLAIEALQYLDALPLPNAKCAYSCGSAETSTLTVMVLVFASVKITPRKGETSE